MKTEAIETMLSNLECRLHSWERQDGFFEHDKIKEARAELAALKSTAEDLECLLGEAQVENKELRKENESLRRRAESAEALTESIPDIALGIDEEEK